MNPFGDQDAKLKLMKDPITAAYMQEEDFRNIVNELHKNLKELGYNPKPLSSATH